jgi:membrane protease YdiL (CAAX protease family)
VTPTYGLLAGILGCYLSLTLRLSNEPNLIVPIISHALYDFVAFIAVASDWRRDHLQDLPECDDPISQKIPHSP